MTEQSKETAARTAVQGLLRADKMKALAVAALLATTSVTGCTAAPYNQPCPGQPGEAPCVQPSGTESGWLAAPRWPAAEGAPGAVQGKHLATETDFAANPQYTQLRAGSGSSSSGSSIGPRYYGGSHYYGTYGSYSSGGSSGGSSGFSS